MADGGNIAHVKAQETFNRYEYGRVRGHSGYQRQARRNEEMYLGGGLQWTEEDRAALEEAGRPAYEVNVIKVAVESAVGYQINNRLDISFAPRGGEADDKSSEILNRVVMQVADNVNLHWKETQVFSDGMIQQRGYYDVRLDFDESMRGELQVAALDPLDVIPDPDGKDYDPDTWADVIVTRWLTIDEVEQTYGRKARQALERDGEERDEEDWGEQEADGVPRSKFGYQAAGTYSDHVLQRPGEKINRVRIIDRQRWVHSLVRVAVTKEGDVRQIEGMEEDRIARLEAAGAVITRRMQRRVRWTVTTEDTVLHDDWSPYPWFTIVPYFPYFRRGQTRGMVDNAIGPQEIINKAISQYIHVVNTTANSGWIVEEGSLKNLSTDDLEVHGSESGLVIEYRQNRQKPEKITPNQVPTGVDRIIDRAFDALKEVTVPDAMRGTEGRQDDSGVAIQSRQFAAQQQLAVALDNLARTRNMLARRILWIVQHYYDEERIFRITETEPSTGKEVSYDLGVNVYNPITGNVVNDLTVGEYDVVIGEQPMQITFGNSQFEQAMRMREAGIGIPDATLVRTSMLSDKTEILEQMQRQSEAQQDPAAEADVKLKLAQAGKAEADAAKAQQEAKKIGNDAVGASVEAQYSAIQTAQTIAQLPQTAPLADSILLSAGYVDQDAAPIVPNYNGQPARSVPGKFVVATDGQGGSEGDTNGDGTINGGDIAGVPENTNPLTPTNPDRGLNAGIEGGEPQE